MSAPHVFAGSRSAPRWSLIELKQRYFRLLARFGLALWDTLEGKELEQLLERDDLFIRDGSYTFACPRTITLYWNLQDCLDAAHRHFLVVGERGTGKEVIANLIAQKGGQRVISVNCATLTDSIADSLLFGISSQSGLPGIPKGGQDGFVGQANRQVLFLDEFFDAPPSVFPKLLRLLQEPRAYYRVGEATERFLDESTKIVAASNKYPSLAALRKALDERKIRADLIERFEHHCEIPPLRERKKEISRIAENIIAQYKPQNVSGQPQILQIGDGTARLLRHHPYDWPGNVRELERKLKERARLLRWESPASDTVNIAQESLDQWQSERVQVASAAPSLQSLVTNPLSTWTPEGLRELREQELLRYLRDQLQAHDLAEATEGWVAEQCRKVLQIKNISQRLHDTIKLGCKKIARKLNGLSPD